jgi:transglutaminase-like putative cysteine protease
MEQTVNIDDQPISAGFFGEGKWISDYVTPDEPDIIMLYENITKGINEQKDRIVACWDWVANKVRYKPFISAQISVEGIKDSQEDYWQTPSLCSKTQVGNCANKAFLLTSLLRNELRPEQVYAVLGNLYNGKPEGHAWVQVNLGGEYIVESTRGDVPMVDVSVASRYEPVHYFNDTVVMAVPGRTLMVPFSACYSDWLRDYLNWSYING